MRMMPLAALLLACGTVWSVTAQDSEQPPAPPVPSDPPAAPEQPQEDATPAPPEEALPDAKDLIDQSRLAVGSLEAIAALKSVSIKATLALPTGENHFDARSTRSGAFRFEQRSQEQPGVAVYFDGKVGWIVHSDLRYELIDEFTLTRGQHQFHAMFPLWIVLFPEDHYTAFQTVERSTFNERECYKVQLTDDDNVGRIERFVHFDVEERLVRGMTVAQDTPNGPVSVQFRFDEWKQIDQIKVFTRVSIDQPNQPLVVNYTQIEFNTVEESLFEQPAEVKQLVEKRDVPPPLPPSDADDTPADDDEPDQDQE